MTWEVRILEYASAHDAGTIINPKLVEGQRYGAALHGLGGALLRGVPLGRGRPVPDRHVRRLPLPDGGRGAADRHGAHRDAVAVHAGRREGLRRVVVGDGAGGGRERGRRRAAAARAEAVAPAADTGAALGAGPRGTAEREARAVRLPPARHARRGARAARGRSRTRSRSPAGQSLVPMLNFRLARPSALVDLGGIEELAGIRVEDGALVVGAMTRQWDLEHAAGRLPAAARGARVRRAHGDALPRNRRRLARPRRPDRRAAGVRARARGGAGHEPSHDPGRGVLRLGVHDRAGAGRAAGRGALPGGRAARPRSWSTLTVTATSPSSASPGTATGSPSAASAPTPVLWDGGELDPVGDLFAPAGYKREVAAALIERATA